MLLAGGDAFVQQVADAGHLVGVGFVAEVAGEVGCAQPEQVGRQGVELVVMDDGLRVAGQPQVEHVVAAGVDLARHAAGGGEVVEPRHRLAPAAADDLLQIDVPLVVLDEIIIPFPTFFRAAAEAGGADALGDAALDEDGQVGVARIETDERRLGVGRAQSGQEAVEQLALGHRFFARVGQRGQAEKDLAVGLRLAHDDGHGHDAAEHRLEVGARFLLGRPAGGPHGGVDVGVGRVGRQVVGAAAAGGVGNPFEIESPDVGGGGADHGGGSSNCAR